MKKRTKYDDVYIDDNGVIFYQIECQSEGKRIRKKCKVEVMVSLFCLLLKLIKR